MGRHHSDNPASESIRLRCTPDDKAELIKRATDAGVTLSQYLLACGLGRVKEKA